MTASGLVTMASTLIHLPDLVRFLRDRYDREWWPGEYGQGTYITLTVARYGPGTMTNAQAEGQLSGWLERHAERETLVEHSDSAWLVAQFDVTRSPEPAAIMWHLCRSGIIPEGHYTILVWW